MTKASKNTTKLSTNGNPSKSRQLLFMRDTAISHPELWLKVFVSGPPIDAQGFPEMFARARCYKANTPDEADLVVFTGGPDVDPVYYTQKETHESVFVDAQRDAEDLQLYAKCYDDGIPMFGVCRGAQFGHVMAGGELYMDVDGHQKEHVMYTDKGESVRVSSVHHQMCVENENMDMLGWSSGLSKERWSSANLSHVGHIREVEAFFYPETCFFGVQGHPEYKGYTAFMTWCLKQIEHLIVNNPDIELDKEKGVYRLTQSFRNLRDDFPSELTVEKETKRA